MSEQNIVPNNEIIIGAMTKLHQDLVNAAEVVLKYKIRLERPDETVSEDGNMNLQQGPGGVQVLAETEDFSVVYTDKTKLAELMQIPGVNL